MPLIGTEAALAAEMAVVVGPAAAVQWAVIGTAFLTWASTSPNVTAVSVVPNTLVAVPPIVTGSGSVIATGVALGPMLGVASLSVLPPALNAWIAIGNVIGAWLTSNAQVDPTLLISNPLGGPITGFGGMQIANKLAGAAIASALNSTNPFLIDTWNKVCVVLFAHLEANAVLNPTSFVAPLGGGLITGVGNFN